MRSRYSAYVTGNVAYLINTVHPRTRHLHDPISIGQWSSTAQWQGKLKKKRLGLTVTSSTVSPDTTQGTVLFTVTYGDNGKLRTMTEHSRFERLDIRWYYVGML